MAAPLQNTSILIVDDNEDTRELLKIVFEQAGASVVEAHSVETALEAFRRCPAHAVVTDIRLGTSDGYALTRAIRELNAEYKGFTPIIAITGYASSEDEERAKEAGFCAYFSKPFNPMEVVEAMRSVLSSSLDLSA